MKISCNVIKDLLLLYENGEASEETVKLVEEHFAECSSCRELFSSNQEEVIIDDILSESEKAEVKAVKNGLGKVKKRWKLSLVSILMIIPLLGVGILSFHQCTGYGVAFTNIDEIFLAKKFTNLIKEENYEEAASMLNYTVDYESVLDVLSDGQPLLEEIYGQNPTAKEYTEKRNEKLLEYLDDFKESGYKISNIRFNQIYSMVDEEGNNYWNVYISFEEIASDGFKQMVIVDFRCKNGEISQIGVMSEERMSAFDYAMNFNNMWHLEETLTYEEYLKMENM